MGLETDSLGLGLKSLPASFVGGDLVDAFELSEGHFRFLMADTTGHGVQAALRTMVLKTEYEAIKWQQEWPHALVASLNDVLAANFPDLELRSTAVCFDLVRMTNGGWELRVANAAAPELFLLTGPDLVEIYQPGPFLAMMLGATFILDDPIFNGLAISLIFGILVSTLLTLVVIPVLYYAAYGRRPAPPP